MLNLSNYIYKLGFPHFLFSKYLSDYHVTHSKFVVRNITFSSITSSVVILLSICVSDVYTCALDIAVVTNTTIRHKLATAKLTGMTYQPSIRLCLVFFPLMSTPQSR